jgi:uncharacterized protein
MAVSRHRTSGKNVPKIAHDNLRLVHDADRDRYELLQADTFIGFEGYDVGEDGVITLLHTIIDEKYGRQGYARALVTLILEDMRAKEQKMKPVCTYVQGYLERFPEYKDLVA